MFRPASVNQPLVHQLSDDVIEAPVVEKADLTGRVILIVEDEPAIAMDLQDAFANHHARIITAYRLERALELARVATLSAAVIDFSLAASNNGSLLSLLKAREVPFAFFTGRSAQELGAWQHVPCIRKPAHPDDVVRLVARLLMP